MSGGDILIFSVISEISGQSTKATEDLFNAFVTVLSKVLAEFSGCLNNTLL